MSEIDPVALEEWRAQARAWLVEKAAGGRIDVAALPAAAEARCRTFAAQISSAIAAPRDVYLAEDYFVFTVTSSICPA